MRYFLRALVAISVVTLSGCRQGVLDPKGPIAEAERQILFNSLGIMLAIVIPTILATLAVVFWFRSSNKRAVYLPDFEYSGRLELLVWSIYPEQGIASVNHLTIPAGTPVSFELTSSGVMNSFFVPQLGSQIYTMAGMTTRLQLQADHAGSYRVLSANFSGDGFADMRFTVDAVPPEQFARWVAAARNSGPDLNAATYADLAKPSQAVAPYTYRSLAPGLFNAIANAGMAMRAPGEMQSAVMEMGR